MEVTDRRSPRYVTILALAACLILVVGWLVRPREIPQSPPPVPSETELQELARRAQRRSLESMTAYFAELATDVRSSLAYVPSVGGSGIVWDEAHVVTGPMAAQAGPVTVRTAAGDRIAEATSSRRLPLSILAVTLDPSARIAHRAAALPHAGDWIFAVWQTDQTAAFATANFGQTATATCGVVQVRDVVSSMPLSRPMIGGGVFNMERELLGVILPCGDRVAAIEPSSIDDLLRRAVAVEERVLTLYGVLFGTFSQAERRYFTEADDLLAREVWIGSRAEAAGLRPGDVVVALNGQPVTSVDELRPLMTRSEAPFELRVRRDSRTEALTLNSNSPPAATSDNATNAGLVLESPAPTYRIESLLPGSRAARAGLEPGDRLIRINRSELRSRAQAERAITTATSKPILLEVQRDGRRIALVLPESTAR